MSYSFSAEQYNQAYDPKRLQNWQTPRTHKERPSAQEGFTQFIADKKGALTEDVRRSKQSPWGTFVPTWDMPTKLPGPKVCNPTSRTTKAHALLTGEARECCRVLTGGNKVPCDKAQPTGQARPAACHGSAKLFPPEDEGTRSGAANPCPPCSGMKCDGKCAANCYKAFASAAADCPMMKAACAKGGCDEMKAMCAKACSKGDCTKADCAKAMCSKGGCAKEACC